jgi:hypothetical protein
VSAAHLVRHRTDADAPEPAGEAVEIAFGPGDSVLLGAGMDWTLQVSAGRWPELPDWCRPPEEWSFRELRRIGGSGLDTLYEVSPVRNEVGELSGVTLRFPAGSLLVRSGERVTCEMSPDRRDDG